MEDQVTKLFSDEAVQQQEYMHNLMKETFMYSEKLLANLRQISLADEVAEYFEASAVTIHAGGEEIRVK